MRRAPTTRRRRASEFSDGRPDAPRAARRDGAGAEPLIGREEAPGDIPAAASDAPGRGATTRRGAGTADAAPRTPAGRSPTVEATGRERARATPALGSDPVPPSRTVGRPERGTGGAFAFLLLLAAGATGLAAIASAPEARAAADTAGVATAPAPAPATTGLLRPRIVPAPLAGGKGPRRPSGEALPADPLARRLHDEHVRARGDAGPPRRAFRTIVVCQRPGAPWRDRLAAYLDRLFAGEPPFRVVDAAHVRRVPPRATVAAFAADDAAALACLDAARGLRDFAETSPRPRRIFGRPVLCPSSVGLRGTRVRFYVADMTHPGRACEAARFGEILGLPGWARDPAENGDRLPAIRAHLRDLYAPLAATAGPAPVGTRGGAADARGRIGSPPVTFTPR